MGVERKGKQGLNFILGVSKSTIERNVLEPMRKQWGDRLIGTINSENIARIFGEKVYCLGAEKVSQVSKLRGAEAKYVYCDELVEFIQEVFDLLNDLCAEEKVLEKLRYEEYMAEVEELLDNLHLNDLAKQQYLDFAMFCLGLQSTNIKAVVVPDWKEDVAKAIAGDKASAQEKFWDRSDSIAWNVDSLHSKYLAVLQVLQV